ncbi:putative nucleotidyltransferase [uncultured archaeon]|nr:putative nucleotidyltransferase [uncultured archaeon]
MLPLFQTLFGSRLYGTSTPESDWDWKEIVLPDLDDLLVGNNVQTVVKKTNTTQNQKNSSNDVDFEHISIQKFAKDFLKGQTYALELAYAVKYRAAHQIIFNSRFEKFCETLRNEFQNVNITALMGYAVHQANIYSFKGERLNALETANILFEEMIAKYGSDEKVFVHAEDFEKEANIIAEQYPKYCSLTTFPIDNRGTMQSCMKLLEKILPYRNSFGINQKIVRASLKNYGSRARSASENSLDLKAIMHAIRILGEGIQILSRHDLVFPLGTNEISLLMKIRAGKMHKEKIHTLIGNRLDELKSLEKTSRLPKLDDALKIKFGEFLTEEMRKFYAI